MRNKEKLFSIAMISLITLIVLVSIAGAEPYAYITNYDDNTVSVINTATNEVTTTVSVDNGPGGVAVNPAGTKVYVLNCNSNSVSVINTTTNTVTDTVNLGVRPFGVAVNPTGTNVYVTSSSGPVSIIDTSTNTVKDTVPVGSGSEGAVVSPDGTKVYVANFFSSDVSVIDTGTNTVIATVPVGANPQGVAVNPAGTKVYVTNCNSDSVSVIDTATDKVIATVAPLGRGPNGVVVTPDGTKLYVTNPYSNDLSVIDATTDTVITTVKLGILPCGVAVTPDGTKVYVTNAKSNNVSVIDTATNAVTTTVNVGNFPSGFGLFIGTLPNIAPTINSITVPFDPVPVDASIKTSADVTYLGDLSTLTAEWNWGDGSASEPQASSNFVASHAYNSAGVYTVTFTLKDKNGGIYTQTSPNCVVVYDPQGGFVTGGGWINSPAGAYAENKDLAGRASFGFVSKYQKGSTVPTGNTQFQFNVANLNFHSESYDWLVVAGSQAKFKGTGTINGQGNYGFMLSAVDGAVDKFKIKIWDKGTNEVIYDNEIGAAENAEPTTAIGGGSIIIHTGK